MSRQSTARMMVFLIATVMLVLGATTFVGYYATLHASQAPSDSSMVGYLQYLLFLFILPIALLFLFSSAAQRLVVRFRLEDALAMALFIAASVGFCDMLRGTLREVLPHLSHLGPKIIKLLAFSVSGSIQMGLLIGILTGAKVNWKRGNNLTPPTRDEIADRAIDPDIQRELRSISAEFDSEIKSE